MREVFSKRLYNARRQAGLSQDQLVALIEGKVKKTAIAKYERGEMMAEPEVIMALAKALNQKFDYFFRPFTVSVSNVEFRAKASLGARKEETLRHDIISRIERYLELKRILNDNTRFDNPFKGRLVSTAEDAEQAAIELYDHWALGKEGIGDVMSLLEDKGIAVIDIDADDSFDGYSAYVNDEIPVIVLRGKANTTERRRFTALHEMAHLLFTFDENASKMEKERLCNRFAGAVLLPAKILVRELGRYRSYISPAEMAIIKDRYGISALALITRAFQLEVISKFTFIRLKDYITTDKLEMHIGSNKRVDKPTRFDLMLLHALSEELISVTKAADLAGKSLDELVKQYLIHEKPFHY
jgi:Zn-dependent peptidase ImmA (M78 family)/DNA-binding XRE family transcriptional regulator